MDAVYLVTSCLTALDVAAWKSRVIAVLLKSFFSELRAASYRTNEKKMQ